jgi:hypothetical protein
LMGFEHGRGAPVPRLPQARDPLARLAKVAAADGEGNGALSLGVPRFGPRTLGATIDCVVGTPVAAVRSSSASEELPATPLAARKPTKASSPWRTGSVHSRVPIPGRGSSR